MGYLCAEFVFTLTSTISVINVTRGFVKIV